ncbi:MAG: hypothetical protein HKN80_05680 [Acidimicrobiia bacterium]|nr:hypothetical protein [Acidimicrobiia bacterium]
MRIPRRLAVAATTVGLALALTGCSTMDDVKVSHSCDTPVSVTVARVASPGSTDQVDQAIVAPSEVTVVTGFINMNADDIVHLTADGSGWEIELTRSELRDRDGVITLPPEACP